MRIPVSPEQLKHRLLADGVIDEAGFEACKLEASRKNQSLLDVLISAKNIDPNYLYSQIAAILGVPRVNFSVTPPADALVKLLPEDISRQRNVVIFGEADGAYLAAMADPSDLETVRFLSQYLNRRVVPYLATDNDLNRAFSIFGLQTAGDFKKIIEKNIEQTLKNSNKSAEEAAADLPIVAIVDSLLSYAASMHASDLHMEVLEEATLVRYRIDGVLYEILRIPKSVHPALAARIKLLAGLKIDEHYRPQDGRFRYQIVNTIVDVRVSILPTFYGETIVMRLLESSQKPLSLEELGLLPAAAAKVTENLRKSYGMILVCGPTGSGKSTTLYALINILNRPNVNIVTIEDPVEYNMRYVNQSQINPAAGITFAAGLKSILRQDPNIIMVGEMRDGETGNIAVQAALTGHLLLSTLHTNDAPTAIPRLFDFGIAPFLVSSVLNVIIAQRLVRKVCRACLYSLPLEPAQHASILVQFKNLNLPVDENKIPTIVFKGKGCNVCGGTGYKGRLGIFEVLEATDPIRRIINSPDFSLDRLKEQARADGVQTMFEDGLAKVQLGETTLEEVLRVIQE
jgi:type II secretory ATPase GspE/PulE/Tfp pilus assembly ATPase PilB-like protein